MPVRTVAILSPGDMGSAVGSALGEHGLDVVTCLASRSARTRDLAAKAGIRDLPELEAVVREADLILSILVPSEALSLGEQVATALKAIGAGVAFADCNAVSPGTARRLDEIITSAGGRFIDAGIIGSPPGRGAAPRFYASGPEAAILGELDGKGIDVPVMSGPVGHASGIKMCYAALTKGTPALQTALLVTAERLGLSADLHAELESSQPAALKAMERGVPTLPAKAFRWVGEMEEIAATFREVGVTPNLHLGAADVFRMVSESPLGSERPETVDRGRTLSATIRVFADGLGSQAG